MCVCVCVADALTRTERRCGVCGACVRHGIQYGPGASFRGTTDGRPLLPSLRRVRPTLFSEFAALHIGAPGGLHPSTYYRSGMNGGDGGTNVTLRVPEFPTGLVELGDQGKNVRSQIYSVLFKSLKERAPMTTHWALADSSSRGSKARSVVRGLVSALLHVYVLCAKETGNRDSNAATFVGALTRLEVTRLIRKLPVDFDLVRPRLAVADSFVGVLPAQERWADKHWSKDAVLPTVEATFSDLVLCVGGKVDEDQRIFEYAVCVCQLKARRVV